MVVSKREIPAEQSAYTFGPFRLQFDGTLVRDGRIVLITPKELALLRLLLAHSGSIVPSQQLRHAAWGSVHVSADSLPRCISSLRATLDCDRCISTIYKHGYRFNLPVTVNRAQAAETSGPRLSVVEATNGGSSNLEVPNLDWRLTVAHPAQNQRLAIMPFAAARGVRPSFAGEVVEQIMLRLSRSEATPWPRRAGSPAIQILARDAVSNLAARGLAAHELGSALGADLVLTGSITALPEHLRLLTEMVRVSDAAQLWIEEFILPNAQLDQAGSRMAQRIAARIGGTFSLQDPVAAARMEFRMVGAKPGEFASKAI